MKTEIAFGDNLKFYREKAGLTQCALAQQIGYSEKSVSKWENGGGYPTVEILAELASLFQISLDALIYAKPIRQYLLGIDGGGTSTVFRLTEEDGTVVRTIVKDCVNPVDIGIESAKRLLESGIREISEGIPYFCVTLFAGISGGGMSGTYAQQLGDFFSTFGFRRFQNGSDVENVLALVPKNNCILVIMGTGFITYCIRDRHRKRIAGWGQLFDQGGSGYAIGRDGIMSALRNLDGSGDQTALTELLTQRLGQTPEQHLTAFYEGGKKYIASFADAVFTAAKQEDHVAQRILEDNMKFVACMIETGQREFPEPVPVYFSGGISKMHEVLFPLLRKYLSKEIPLIPLRQEPIAGAIKNAAAILKQEVSYAENGNA